jgi:hypothetical protein
MPSDRPVRTPSRVTADPSIAPAERAVRTPSRANVPAPTAAPARPAGLDPLFPGARKRNTLGLLGLIGAGIAASVAGVLIANRTELWPAVTPTPAATPDLVVLFPTPVTATPEPVATATPVTTAQATPVKTRVVVRPAATPVAPGRLNVTARPWVEVWVDGKKVADDTPLRNHSLPAGRHMIRVVHPDSGFSKEAPFDVKADGEVRVFVDVPSKKLTIE